MNRIRLEDEEGRFAWHPDGRHLALSSVALHGTIHLHDLATGERIRSLAGHANFTPGLAFNAEGTLLASSAWDLTTRLWSIPAGRELLTISGGGWPTFAVDGRRFGVVSWDHDGLFLFDLVPPPPEARRFEMDEAPQEGAESITFNSTGRLLAHSTGESNLVLRDTATLGVLARWTNCAPGIVLPDPGSEGFLLGSGRSRLPMGRDPATSAAQIGTLQPWGPTNHFGAVALSLDGRLMAGITPQAEIYVANLGNDTVPRHLGRQKQATFIAVSPDRLWVATGAWNLGGVKVWNVEQGKLERELPTGSMANVAFSPDGRTLVTSGQSFDFWSVGRWDKTFSLSRPPMVVFPSPLAFTRDGTMLALCSDSRSVRLVNPQTGIEYATLELPNAWSINALNFSPDGAQLAMSGMWTQEFCVWDLRRVRERLAALKLDWDLPPYTRATTPAPSLR